MGRPCGSADPSRDPARTAYPAETLEDVRRPSFTSFLDLARWTAAGLVFVGHLRDPLLLGYGDLAHADRTWWVRSWYFVTGLHAEAVVVFFVLSGYLVGGMAMGKLQLGRFVPATYAVDRATRILLPFFPALLLTVGLDWMGSHWFPAAGLYDHSQAMIREKLPGMGAFTDDMSPGIFGVNLVLLQTFFGPPYGSNQPLWTISAEFWFYVVFGLVAFGACRPRSWAGIGGFVMALAASAILGSEFVLLLGLWVVGVGAASIPRGRHEQALAAALVFAGLLIAIRLKQDLFDTDALLRTVKNYVVALAFGWLLVSMRRRDSRVLASLSALNRRMADFSYSLYLIHFPAMIFLLSALYATGWFPRIAAGYRPTDPTGLGLYLGLIAAVYGLAWMFSQLTERQTGRLRTILT